MNLANAASTVARRGYLVVGTTPTDLALDAANVLGVMRSTEWPSQVPRSLGDFLPIDFVARQPEWILSVGQPDRPTAILVKGNLRVSYFSNDALLPMPTHVNNDAFGMFSSVVLEKGRPSALVLKVEVLVRLHQELGK